MASGAKAGKVRCGYLSFLLWPLHLPSTAVRAGALFSASLCLCISKHGPEWAPRVGLSLTVCVTLGLSIHSFESPSSKFQGETVGLGHLDSSVHSWSSQL